MDSLLSPQEANKLKESVSREDLENLFFGAFIKGGDEEEKARQMAKEWADEIVSGRPD